MTRKNPARRQELIVAAQHLFYTKGYENTSINDIIKAEGVSKGAFYHHFDSKAAVLEATVAQMMDQATADLREIIADETLAAIPKWQKVVQLSQRWKIGQSSEVAEVGRILEKEENILLHHKLRTEWLKNAHEIAKVVEQGISEGVFNVDHVSETAVLLLTVTSHFNDEVGQLIADQEKFADPVNLAWQKYSALQSVVERLLGAPAGSMPLAEKDAIGGWFVNLE